MQVCSTANPVDRRHRELWSDRSEAKFSIYDILTLCSLTAPANRLPAGARRVILSPIRSKNTGADGLQKRLPIGCAGWPGQCRTKRRSR